MPQPILRSLVPAIRAVARVVQGIPAAVASSTQTAGTMVAFSTPAPGPATTVEAIAETQEMAVMAAMVGWEGTGATCTSHERP